MLTKMKFMSGQLTAIAGAVWFCLAFPALGQKVSVTATSVGTTTWYDGTTNQIVNIGPYQVSVNGGSSLKFVCDDYEDTFYKGETWTATEIKVDSINSSDIGSLNLKFFQGASQNQAEGYAVLADLTEDMFLGKPAGFTDTDLNAAIWYLTSDGNYVGFFKLNTSTRTLVKNLMAEFGGTVNASGFEVFNTSSADISAAYAALAGDKGLTLLADSSGAQQGFLVPEGGAALLYLLLALSACLGALVVSRKNNGPAAEMREMAPL